MLSAALSFAICLGIVGSDCTREKQMVGQDAPREIADMEKIEDSVDSKDEVTLDPRIQLELGRALRAYTDDIVNAPIPAKFLSLLARLEAEERRSK
jgi:hypothetical protein